MLSVAVQPSTIYLNLPSSLHLLFLGAGAVVPSLPLSICSPGWEWIFVQHHFSPLSSPFRAELSREPLSSSPHLYP